MADCHYVRREVFGYQDHTRRERVSALFIYGVMVAAQQKLGIVDGKESSGGKERVR